MKRINGVPQSIPSSIEVLREPKKVEAQCQEEAVMEAPLAPPPNNKSGVSSSGPGPLLSNLKVPCVF